MSTFKVECPECQKVLKPANPIAPGKKVKCPGCKAIFTMPAAKPTAATAIKAKNGALPAKRALDEDDDELENLPPKKKRRLDEDEDEDRPRNKKRRDVDDDEDDDDEAPRKKKKKKTKGPNMPLLLGVGGGGGLVLILLITAFLWPGFLLSSANPPAPAGPGPGPNPGPGPVGPVAGAAGDNVFALLPANCTVVLGVDLDKVRKDPIGKDLEKMLMESIQKQPDGGQEFAQVARDAKKIVGGLVFDGLAMEPTGLVILQADNPFNQDKIRKAFEGPKQQSKNHQGKTYYASTEKPNEFAGTFNDKLLLAGKMPETQFMDALTSDGKTVRLPADMLATIASVDKAVVWGAVAMEGAIKQQLQMIQPDALPPELQGVIAPLQAAKGISFSLETQNKDVIVNLGIYCANDQDAATLKQVASDFWTKQGKMMLDMATLFLPPMPETKILKDRLNETSKSLAFANKGAVAQVSLRISEQTVKTLQNTAKNIGNPGKGPRPIDPKFPPPIPKTDPNIPPKDPNPTTKPPDNTKPPVTKGPDDGKKKDQEERLATLKLREQKEVLPLEVGIKSLKATIFQYEQQLQLVKNQLRTPKLPAQVRQKLQLSEQQYQQTITALNAKVQAAEQQLLQKRQEIDQERQKILAGT